LPACPAHAPFPAADQLPVPRFAMPGFGAGLDEIPKREFPDGRGPAYAFFLLAVDVGV